MEICLDTNVFSSKPEFFIWMDERGVKGYLPSIAYMELSYHEMKKFNGSIARFNSMLGGLGIIVVPFDMDLAHLAAANALSRNDLARHAMDYAIGAFAYKRKMPLVTNNKKDFTWLKEVYTPAEAMLRLS